MASIPMSSPVRTVVLWPGGLVVRFLQAEPYPASSDVLVSSAFYRAVAIILRMVETLGQSDGVMRTGFRRTKICSLPRFGSSVLRRRISSAHRDASAFFVAPEVPYCAGLAPQVLPCSVTDATSKACGRIRQRLQKLQKYRVYPRSAEPSFSLLLYQPSLKALNA